MPAPCGFGDEQRRRLEDVRDLLVTVEMNQKLQADRDRERTADLNAAYERQKKSLEMQEQIGKNLKLLVWALLAVALASGGEVVQRIAPKVIELISSHHTEAVAAPQQGPQE